jgi:hypothetical protein
MDPDSDPRGPKTNGSGSATLRNNEEKAVQTLGGELHARIQSFPNTKEQFDTNFELLTVNTCK